MDADLDAVVTVIQKNARRMNVRCADKRRKAAAAAERKKARAAANDEEAGVHKVHEVYYIYYINYILIHYTL
jgi:hypothetical protein